MQDKENRYLKLITECEGITLEIGQKTKLIQYNSPRVSSTEECYTGGDSELEKRLNDLKISLRELNSIIVA